MDDIDQDLDLNAEDSEAGADEFELNSAPSSSVDLSPIAIPDMPADLSQILAAPAPSEALGKPPENGAGLLSDKDISKLAQEYDKQVKYGDQPIKAATLGALSGLTFSLSDRALQESGLMTQEDLREIADRNPEADITGQVAGALVPAFVTGGASAPASAALGAAKLGVRAGAKAASKAALKASMPSVANKAGLVVEKKIAKMFGEVAAETGNKKIVSEIVKKSVAKGAGSAVEGSVWGANQLLREDALGKAELNAENLLGYMSDGAAVGGALGAALVPGGAILKGVGGGLSKGLKKAGAAVFDEVRDVAKLLGLTPTQVAKFKEKNPKFLEELPNWVRTKLDLKHMDTSDTLLSKLDGVKTSAITRIDDAIKQLDEAAKSKGQQIGGGIYDDVADQLENNFIVAKEGVEQIAVPSEKIKETIARLRAQAAEARLTGQGTTFTGLRNARIEMDKLAKDFFKKMEPGEAAKAHFMARDALKKVITKYADVIEPRLARELSEANLDYHYATTLRNQMSKKAEAAQAFVSFKDLLLGGAASIVDPTFGMTVAAANKFMRSDMKRKIVILSQVEKGAKGVTRRLEEAIANFFKKAAKPAKIGSLGILVRSELASRPNEEKPKKRLQAYRNVQQNLVELAADPLKLEDRIAKSTSVLAQGAPATARGMGDTMRRAVRFLTDKMPKDARDSAYSQFEPEYEPSTIELATFERYMQVVEQPLSVLRELESGSLTRDHVEALKAVFPNLYNEIRITALNEARNNPKLTYSKRIQLGILLDIPADSSLSPQFVVQMQQNFVPPEQRQEGALQGAVQDGQKAQGAPPPQQAVSRLNSGSRAETETQRVAKGPKS